MAPKSGFGTLMAQPLFDQAQHEGIHAALEIELGLASAKPRDQDAFLLGAAGRFELAKRLGAVRVLLAKLVDFDAVWNHSRVSRELDFSEAV